MNAGMGLAIPRRRSQFGPVDSVLWVVWMLLQFRSERNTAKSEQKNMTVLIERLTRTVRITETQGKWLRILLE